MFIVRKGLILFCLLLWLQDSKAILFDRRPVTLPSLTYYVVPIAGNIPGVQSFYGINGSVAGIGNTDVTLSAILLQGEPNENFAENGNDGNFELQIYLLNNIPILEPFTDSKWKDRLNLSFYYGSGQNVGFPQRERGIDSKEDEFTFILLNEFDFNGGELSLNFYDNQVGFYYAKLSGNADPFGFVDNNGNFTSAENAKVFDRGDGGRYGLYLDDTDNRRDPRVGYRFQYERYNLSTTRGEAPAYYQNDYNLTGFIPILADNRGVLVLNQFFSTAIVTEEGEVLDDVEGSSCEDPESLRCGIAREEARKGNATALGGTLRLRGYPSNRFFDSYTNFQGIEFRWYLLEVEKAFDVIVQRGIYTSLQLAAFYEQGTVAPDTSEIWENFKNSYGVGVRAVLTSLVVRMDFGFSDEGNETTVFVGYPF